eukprot:TRINITY_DN29967_c0_g1_i1.p1 TRINITY_DN29967_c0_g1~~TRINITY_DN29967_c0_g1_i1.p1  ORF type:complete len:204 (-),score=41.63 TRINITY_DN29967_c0_g1_i1:285-896(-)
MSPVWAEDKFYAFECRVFDFGSCSKRVLVVPVSLCEAFGGFGHPDTANALSGSCIVRWRGLGVEDKKLPAPGQSLVLLETTKHFQRQSCITMSCRGACGDNNRQRTLHAGERLLLGHCSQFRARHFPGNRARVHLSARGFCQQLQTRTGDPGLLSSRQLAGKDAVPIILVVDGMPCQLERMQQRKVAFSLHIPGSESLFSPIG